MDMNTFRGFLCGMLCMALILVGNPLYAEASGSTAYNQINTQLANIVTAINNQAGSSSSSAAPAGIRARCAASTTIGGNTTNTVSGKGFIVCNYGWIAVKLDGCTTNLYGTFIGNSTGYASIGQNTSIGYFSSSAQITTTTQGCGAIYIYT